MPKVQLPPGCRSLRFQDGTRVAAAREGGYVNVSEGHAQAIDQMAGNGDAGLLSASGAVYGAVRKPGRVCTRCGFHAYPWSMTCPRTGCGAETRPE